MTLAQADALARVTGRQFSAPREVVRQTVIDRTSAMRASVAHQPDLTDEREFRATQALMRANRNATL